ncbi:hypothetical protein BQ8794_50247 [Mesorhizobium prunaredense]|uniref:Uncharacterized protein n=1 Tax=Mesorhizobium prunaredense TaxID=1631249 RepID=A0A1R3VE25_9HYPH|nr:Gfo/Idh/MocA family oxidoreductase [Mesorhizobium prunaredense]SIT58145.1 hypothetical protein BQ8794_50247 [Mesorhizobium prunaredense]
MDQSDAAGIQVLRLDTGRTVVSGAQSTVGVVGAGSIANSMHIPVLRAMQNVEIAWISDANAGRAAATADANRLKSIALDQIGKSIPIPDFVLLAIPLPARPAYFDKFQLGRSAIMAEKPFALDGAEHKRLLANFPVWRLACGYQRRFYATMICLRNIVRSGIFGELRGINVQEGGRLTRAGVQGYIDASTMDGGGLVKNLGCHSLDSILWITGASRYELTVRSIEWDGGTDRHASARFRLDDLESPFAESCDVTWRVSWLEQQSNLFRLNFENASLSCPIRPSESIDLSDGQGNKIGALSVSGTGAALTATQAFYLEWLNFIECAGQEKESLLSAASCLGVSELMDELLQR